MAVRRLEEVEGAVGVDREIGMGIAGRPVVGRLRGGVDDDGDILGVIAEKIIDEIAVANVVGEMPVALDGLFEFAPAPW